MNYSKHNPPKALSHVQRMMPELGVGENRVDSSIEEHTCSLDLHHPTATVEQSPSPTTVERLSPANDSTSEEDHDERPSSLDGPDYKRFPRCNDGPTLVS